MTTSGTNRHDPMEIASYLAARTVMLAVVAAVGLALAAISIAVLVYFVGPLNPLDYPVWLYDVARILASLGGLWFIVFLILSLNSLRHHFWYHNQIVP